MIVDSNFTDDGQQEFRQPDTLPVGNKDRYFVLPDNFRYKTFSKQLRKDGAAKRTTY